MVQISNSTDRKFPIDNALCQFYSKDRKDHVSTLLRGNWGNWGSGPQIISPNYNKMREYVAREFKKACILESAKNYQIGGKLIKTSVNWSDIYFIFLNLI